MTSGLVEIAVTTPLGGEEDDLSFDSGFVPPLAIGNYIWADVNGDGIQDASEEGIEGVVLTLLDSNGDEVASTATDSDGLYMFASADDGYDLLPVADYTITIDSVSYTHLTLPTIYSV